MKRFILSILIFVYAASAHAVAKSPEPKLCNNLFSTDAAVHAKVLDNEKIYDPKDPEGAPSDNYFLDVITVYRGKAEKKIVVFSEMGSSNIPLVVGQEYILFPVQYDDGSWQIFDLQGEGGSGFIYSKEQERLIHAALSKKHASIEGEVVDGNWDAKAGVVLKVSGQNYLKEITTDSEGKFLLNVTPGVYQVIAPKGTEFTIYSASGYNDDPNDHVFKPTLLTAGQCMQLQLRQK